ncbi:hypothetical protein DOE76_13960 [Leifsonia sp. ku-ls]|nr:hypothetical protein DOE76_13960 [Leifsonia sp. ku-ls]
MSSGVPWSSYGNSGGFNINGTSVDIANYNVNIPHDANGYLNWTIGANVGNTGTSTYGTGVSWSASGSGPRIPKTPGAPSLSITSNQGLTVSLNVGIPSGYDDGGSTIDRLWTEYSYNGGAWTGGMTGGWGARSYTNLAPGDYQFRARAHNGVGDGPNTTTGTVGVYGAGKVMVNGVKRPAIGRLKVDGQMRNTIWRVKVNGTWKNVT